MNSKRNYKLNLYIINIKLIYKWVLLQRKKKSTNGQNRGFYRINLKQILEVEFHHENFQRISSISLLYHPSDPIYQLALI